MLVTTGNLEYKELSVLNKGGEHNSPPTTSNPSSKIYDNNKNLRDVSVTYSDNVVEIFKLSRRDAFLNSYGFDLNKYSESKKPAVIKLSKDYDHSPLDILIS